MAGYLFGGSTGLSYEDLQRRRQLTDEMTARILGRQPKNTMEGVGALLSGAAAGISRYRTDKALNEGRGEMTSLFDDLLGKITGQPVASVASGSANALPMPGAGNEMAASSPAPDVSKNGSTFSPFIDTVKAGTKLDDGTTVALRNPYGLSAVAATGRAESGWDPKKAAGDWSDPSESGQAGTSGGVMSWRADRLRNLRAYAASKGEQGNGSPQTQGEFLLRENPQLIAKLNSAKSVEEAQNLMNDAWRFAGYNRAGGEAGRRLGYANSYAPQFTGNSQVASLDPTAGMPSAAAAIETQAPGSGYVDPRVSAPNAQAPMRGNQPAPFDAGRFGDPIKLSEDPAAMGDAGQRLSTQATAYAANPGMPVGGLQPLPPQAAPPQPVEVAQAGDGQGSYFPPAPRSPAVQPMPSQPQFDQRWIRLMTSPFTPPEMRAFAAERVQSYLDSQDPSKQLDRQYKQAQIDALTSKGSNSEIKIAGNRAFRIGRDGTVTDVTPQNGKGAPDGFRFEGNSVDAQSLNYLIDTGVLTAKQAADIGAGKTVQGPDGSQYFMTPQGLVGVPPGGQPGVVAPNNEGVDIFAGTPMGSGGSTPPAAVPQSVPANTGVPGGTKIGGAKAPSGYQWNDPNDQSKGMMPIPGGPGEEISAEVAGRIGLADSFLANYRSMRERLASGQATGIWDRARAGFDQSSDQAQLYREMESGADALQRMLTGAGMNQTEAETYARRYLPGYSDDAESAVGKLDQLKKELESTRAMVLRGRGNMPSPAGSRVGAGNNSDPMGLR